LKIALTQYQTWRKGSTAAIFFSLLHQDITMAVKAGGKTEILTRDVHLAAEKGQAATDR
jgi:hypothetical protein